MVRPYDWRQWVDSSLSNWIVCTAAEYADAALLPNMGSADVTGMDLSECTPQNCDIHIVQQTQGHA
jgi:hypothetical protein